MDPELEYEDEEQPVGKSERRGGDHIEDYIDEDYLDWD